MDVKQIKQALGAPTAQPIYIKLSDAIREQIHSGVLTAGDSLPPERSLQQELGVSRGTIRKALEVLIRDEYLKSVTGAGTFVLERFDRDSSMGLIGMITSTPHFNSFYPQLTEAFNQGMRQAGYGMMMSLHRENASIVEQLLDEMLAQNISGLAITPPRMGDIDGALNRLRLQGIPTVCITRRRDSNGFDTVAVDNREIGYQAAQYLIEKGHRHILHIGQISYSTGQDRSAGYQQAMFEAGLDPYIIPIQDDSSQLMASASVERPLYPSAQIVERVFAEPEGPTPTAIFCFNDTVAIGVYKALRELGYRIPQDVSLIGVDNLLMIEHFEVPLTTFQLPSQAIGQQAAKLLLQRLEDDKPMPVHNDLRARFIERDSVRDLTS